MKKEKLSLKVRLNHFLMRYWRVLKLTKKPTMPEFKTIVKVSSLGMAVIGLIGFFIRMIKQLIM